MIATSVASSGLLSTKRRRKTEIRETTDTDDIFFSKIILNVLMDFKESYSDYALLNRLLYLPLINGEWFDPMRKIIQEATEKDSYPMNALRTSVGRSDVLALIRKIQKANPHLKEKPRTRETSNTLGDLLDLSPLEVLLLDMCCRFVDANYQLREVFENLDMRFSNPMLMIAVMFKANPREAQKVISGMLFKTGIIGKDQSGAPDGLWGLSGDLTDVFSHKNLTPEDLDRALFPSMLKTKLTLADYPHLEREINFCADIIDKNLSGNKQREAGTNVMLWGLAGTGKTELAIALAAERGWNLKVIGDVSPENMEESSRYSRLMSLKLASKIFRNQPNTVLLFDEMEDLFKHDQNAQFSKAFINRIIETTEIPIIWTTNEIGILGQPVLRRMVYNIGFEIPPKEERLKMWQKYFKDYKVKVEDDALEAAAETYEVAPAVIKNAVHVTATAYGRKKVSRENLFEIVGSLDTLMNYGHKREVKFKETDPTEGVYDLSCINAGLDMEQFTNRLLSAKSQGFALCLYGAPGTGKSEYGRYLAKRMGKKVLFKRASDLQSMWVGECEKNIAKAFEEARKKSMILLIDEGDSFLQDRSKAHASWEVSQVNEMLSQMERHPQPFILTTNRMKDLDAASLRRFTFKLEFNYMTSEQSRRLFKKFFGVEASSALDRNPMLVPGDYANVKKQVDILGITDAEEIYRMIEEETKLKPGKRSSIGF